MSQDDQVEVTPEPHVGRRLRALAAEQGDRPAVLADGRRFTWAQLDERASRLAAALRAAGLTVGGRFAHVDRNHVASLEATLAAGLSGIAHVTLSWRLAADELRYALDHAEVELVLVGYEFADAVRALLPELPRVRRMVVVGGPDDEYEGWLAAHEPVAEPYAGELDDCVLQMYTSGTTGRPKGAMLTHESLMLNAAGQAAQMRMTPESVHLVAMPMFHIGGQAMLAVSIQAGSSIVIARTSDPDELLPIIAAERVTHLFLVPTAYAYLIDAPAVPDHDLSSLRCLLYSGAPMPRATLDRSLTTFKGALAVHGGYGMTEISGMACALPPEEHRNDDHPERLSSIGRVMPSLEWRVVGSDGQDLPPQAVGELWVRGPGVMRGYWRADEATAATITDGWLHTGDLVRADEDGYLYLAGRAKDLIISGGENVYPAEVERVLQAMPGVEEACVVGVPDDVYGEVPKAVIVATDAAPSDERIVAACREQLAKFKCPRTVERVDALPRTGTGKVLKHVVREQFGTATRRSGTDT